VRQGTIAADISALKIALNWAVDHKRKNGEALLEANPLARVKVEQEPKPRRPVAGEPRYLALKKVAPQAPAGFGLALDLVWATGRRIGAVLALQWGHIILDPEKAARLAYELDDEVAWTPAHFPHGGIHWYAGKGTDNKKHEHVGPMNALAREAIEGRRPDITPPDAWLFPAPKDASKALDYHVLKHWYRKAEEAAESGASQGRPLAPLPTWVGDC
jgi:integrase